MGAPRLHFGAGASTEAYEGAVPEPRWHASSVGRPDCTAAAVAVPNDPAAYRYGLHQELAAGQGEYCTCLWVRHLLHLHDVGVWCSRSLARPQCLPVALMLPEAIVAVERGWLRLAVRQNSLDHASKDAQDASSPHW